MDKNNKLSKYIYLICILGFAILHIVIGANLNLTDDEAYYWHWSKYLDISYFDHPPIVAYLIKISIFLFGTTSLGVRFFGAVCIGVASFFVYKTSMYLFNNNNKSIISVVIFNIIPLISMAGSMILPDMPLLMFFSISMYIFVKIIYEKSRNLWYLFGIITGVGMLSKYNMVLVFVSVLIYISITKENRFWLKRKEPYIAVIISMLFFLPVIIWNMNNNWASFGFHLYGRHSHTLSIKPHLMGQFIVSQSLLVSPLLFVGFFIILIKHIKNRGVFILGCYAMPVFLLFFSVSFITQTKVHWAATAYIPMIIIFANFIKSKKWFYATIVIAGLLSSLVYIQSFYPIIPIEPKVDITTDMYGWDIAGQEIDNIYKEYEETEWFLFSNRYQLASQLAFYLPSKTYVYSINDKTEQFDFWENESKLIGRNGIFITHTFYKKNPEDLYSFDRVEQIKEINIYRKNKIYRTFYIYLCYNYKGKK